MLYGLAFGLAGGIVYGFGDELHADDISSKPVIPNQGIHRSLGTAWRVGAVGGALGGAVYATIFALLADPGRWPVDAFRFGGFFALVLALSLFLAFGGYACISHFALRFVLWRSGAIPWRYVRFLDYATERVFLHRVGGGYLFLHRVVQNHFASAVDRSETDAAAS